MKRIMVERTVTYEFNIDDEQNEMDFVDRIVFDSDEVCNAVVSDYVEVNEM